MTATPRGEFNTRIEFQRRTPIANALGGEDDYQWPAIQKAWAKVRYGTGQERRQAAVEGASQVATFRVMSNPKRKSVREQDAISFDARRWNITSIAPIGDEIEFTASTARG